MSNSQSNVNWREIASQVLDAFSGLEHDDVSGSLQSRPDSPCIGVCSTLYTEYCNGCGRHYKEVAQWVSMTEQEKSATWDRVQALGFPLERG